MMILKRAMPINAPRIRRRQLASAFSDYVALFSFMPLGTYRMMSSLMPHFIAAESKIIYYG